MNRFTELVFALDCYRDRINGIVKKYRDTDARDKRTYSPEVYEERHKKTLSASRAEFAGEQQSITARINGIVNDAQDSLKKWACTPVNDKQLSMLSALLSSGLKLNGAEIETLQQSVKGNYFAGRLIDELAKRSGVKGIKPQRNIEDYVKSLRGVINESDIFVKGYCGDSKTYAKELLPAGTSDYLVYAAVSGVPFSANSSILAASALWDGEIPSSKKERLSKDDEEILDKMYEGYTASEDQLKERTEYILSRNPELKEMLSISRKYSEYLPEEDKTSK